MTKIAFIGAGSTVFAKNLLGDIFSYPELADSHIHLMDIDSDRLQTSHLMVQKLAKGLNAAPKIQATTNRREALANANYVITALQVGGYKPSTAIDFEIPARYGLRQTIADTLGIGGIMRALRTIPVFLEMARDMEELCPEVTWLQYVNPMAMNQWALSRATDIKSVGLCHSVQGTAEQLADDIGVPVAEINYLCAGINHMAFYLKFERNGEDLYPQLKRMLDEARVPEWNRVRFEVYKRFGYFVTESSEHFSEYVPWFIKRDRADLIEDFNIPLDEYIHRCEFQIAMWQEMKGVFEDPDSPLEHERSHEYGSGVIHSLETGTPRIIYGNIPNRGLIDNLPQDCCVEVPIFVDKNGLQPTQIGALPPQLAALMQSNINVQSLTVEAALHGKREHVYHAAMLDPHTAAELSLDEITHMVDDLLEAHAGYIPNLR